MISLLSMLPTGIVDDIFRSVIRSYRSEINKEYWLWCTLSHETLYINLAQSFRGRCSFADVYFTTKQTEYMQQEYDKIHYLTLNDALNDLISVIELRTT